MTIGPDYRVLKGGIASLLEVYAKNDSSFKFLPTYSYENNIINVILFPFYYLRILFFLLVNKNYRLVHIHGASHISFYRKYLFFLPIKYILNLKVVYHIHGGAFQKFETQSNIFVKKRIRHFINGSDAIICLSNSWKDFFSNKFNPKNVFVLNNIINYPAKEKITFFKEDKITFLFLGKIVKEKGVFDLLDMLKENKNYFQNKINVIVGGDGDIDKMKKKICELKISELVQFVGWVSGKKKETLLSKSEILLLPSYYEALPISILEAMSYKMPIISTDVGGIPSIVKNNYNGILITPGDKNMLFDGMKYFIENNDKINQYGLNSFQVVQNFFPKKSIEKLHKLYDKLILN